MSLLHNIGLEEEYRRIRQHRAIITEVKSRESKQSTLIFNRVFITELTVFCFCLFFFPPLG